MLDEAERSLRDALCIVASTAKDPRVVFGAGCSEALMAGAVWRAAQEARSVDELGTGGAGAGRSFGKVKAMEAFATALTQIPLIIAESAGMGSQCAHDLA